MYRNVWRFWAWKAEFWKKFPFLLKVAPWTATRSPSAWAAPQLALSDARRGFSLVWTLEPKNNNKKKRLWEKPLKIPHYNSGHSPFQELPWGVFTRPSHPIICPPMETHRNAGCGWTQATLAVPLKRSSLWLDAVWMCAGVTQNWLHLKSASRCYFYTKMGEKNSDLWNALYK